MIYWMNQTKMVIWISVCVSACVQADIAELNVSMERITVALETKGSEVVLAASFMYDAYVKNPTTPDDFLHSDILLEKFEQLSEENRWGYPEYVVIKQFQEWKSGNKEGFLACYAPGYDREQRRLSYTPISEHEQAFAEPLTRILFVDKARFGPYVRLYFINSEVKSSGTTKGATAIPGFLYLKKTDGRYGITSEITNLNLIDPVVGQYTQMTLVEPERRKRVLYNPDTEEMDWFAIDVDETSPPDNKQFFTVFSTDEEAEIPDTFSENYLKVYVKAEPLNVQLQAGQEAEGLRPELEFFQAAVTAYQYGTEEELLEQWTGRMRERLEQQIQLLIENQEWPKLRPSTYNPGRAPLMICRIQTNSETLLYYRAHNNTYSLGISKENEQRKLFAPRGIGRLNIFTNQMFIEAVSRIYSIPRNI